MSGVQLRAMGTTARYAPRIKRATARLSTGQSLIVVPDTNLATANGGDTSGTAKFKVYLSTNADRTAFTEVLNHTPGATLASSTREAVVSICVSENNNLYIAYAATDNSLRFIPFTYSAGTYSAGTEQTVVAADAGNPRRYRAIDIDICATNANPVIATYQADTSAGQGAYIRTYVRLNDGTTWREAWGEFIFSEFILDGSEDVSVAWNKAGISSNLGQYALYYSRAYMGGDKGDKLTEIQFNVSTGADLSGTSLGSWSTDLHKNNAAGSHRGFLFSEANGVWMFGTAVGTSAPFFMCARLRHNTFTGIPQNRTSSSVMNFRDRFLAIYRGFNAYTAVSAEYCDGNFVFGFVGIGETINYLMRSLVMKFPVDPAFDYATSIDKSARVLDNGYVLDDGPLLIAGGGNKNLSSSLYAYNFACMYGADGTSVSTTPGVNPHVMRAVAEDVLSAPEVLAPAYGSVQAVNKITIRISMQNFQPYSNVNGKMQFQIASDAGFTTDLQTITEPDQDAFSYSAVNSTTPPQRVLNYTLQQANALYTGTWFIRARMADDLGGYSAYSEINQFDVYHPPVAQPLSPPNNSSFVYNNGDRTFSWNFSDTEPLDTQSAYRILIVRTDTGATVTDTGKVASSAKSVTINLSSTLKDIPLQWSVALWDTDDTLGPFSTPNTFQVVDPPVVTVTTPVATTVELNTNTGFETNTAGWTGAGGVLTRSTAQFHSGVASGLLTPTGGIPLGSITSDFIAITGSHSYRLSGWLRTPTTWAGGVGLSVDWYTSGGVFISGSDNFLPSLTGATWTQITNTVIAPANATQCKIVAYIAGTPAAGNTLFIDDIQLGRGLTDTALPTVQWSFSAGGTRTQRAFRVVVWDTATDPDTQVGDSGWVFSAATTYTFSTQILEQFGSYRADVYVQDTLGLQDNDFVLFTTDWVEPIDGDASLTSDSFKVTVAWTDANVDPDWAAWRVYRRYMKPSSSDLDVEDTATTWELIHETDEVLTSYTFRDYTAPLNKPIDYVVVQLVDRFGALLESNILSHETITLVGDRYFFVPAIPVGTIASFEASSVVADGFTREVEQNTIHVIGRGRQVQIGDDLGYSGTLTLKLRNPATARLEREFLEYLAGDDAGNVYVKSPFGDVLYVSFGSVSTQRLAGVGSGDLVDVTIPYVEVFDDVPILRAGT